jgi:CheY-like chemotaxis protein
MPSPAILYVEDEESDVLLLRLAFQRAGLSNPLIRAADGAAAIDYLAGNGPFADREQHPLPALVLLDLNLPCKSGPEVLEWLRRQPHFARLPVVVYTSSDRDMDRAKARRLGATDYLVKKSNVNEMASVARGLVQRWISTPASPRP